MKSIRRYNIIDSLIKDCNYKQYETYLNKISDLERLHRKLSLDLLQPADFSSLDISYDNVKELFKITDSLDCKVTQSLKPSNNDIQKFNEFIDEYGNDFDLQEIVKYHVDKISSSFFKRGVYEDIDNLQDKINNYKKIFEIFIEKLAPMIDDKGSKSNKYSLIKLENNERDGYFSINN